MRKQNLALCGNLKLSTLPNGNIKKKILDRDAIIPY